MAAHPGTTVRTAELRLNFDDVQHMRPTYDIAMGVTAVVFAELNRALKAAEDRR